LYKTNNILRGTFGFATIGGQARKNERHNKGNETSTVPKAAYTEKDFEETLYNNREITIR